MYFLPSSPPQSLFVAVQWKIICIFNWFSIEVFAKLEIIRALQSNNLVRYVPVSVCLFLSLACSLAFSPCVCVLFIRFDLPVRLFVQKSRHHLARWTIHRIYRLHNLNFIIYHKNRIHRAKYAGIITLHWNAHKSNRMYYDVICVLRTRSFYGDFDARWTLIFWHYLYNQISMKYKIHWIRERERKKNNIREYLKGIDGEKNPHTYTPIHPAHTKEGRELKIESTINKIIVTFFVQVHRKCPWSILSNRFLQSNGITDLGIAQFLILQFIMIVSLEITRSKPKPKPI